MHKNKHNIDGKAPDIQLRIFFWNRRP